MNKEFNKKTVLKESLKRAIFKESLRQAIHLLMLHEISQSLVPEKSFRKILSNAEKVNDMNSVKLKAGEVTSPQSKNLYMARKSGKLYVLNYYAYHRMPSEMGSRFYVDPMSSLDHDQKEFYFKKLGLHNDGDTKLLSADFEEIADSAIANLKSAPEKLSIFQKLMKYLDDTEHTRRTPKVNPFAATEKHQRDTVPATPKAIAAARLKK
jgi:hypothetical protein